MLQSLVPHPRIRRLPKGPELAQTSSSKPLCFPSPGFHQTESSPDFSTRHSQLKFPLRECLQGLDAHRIWSLQGAGAGFIPLDVSASSLSPNPAELRVQSPGVSPARNEDFSMSWRFFPSEDDSSGTERGLECDAHPLLLPPSQQDSEEWEGAPRSQ